MFCRLINQKLNIWVKIENNQHYVWHKKGTTFQHKNIVPIVKYDGGSLIWACFTASGAGSPDIIEGYMNSQVYQNVKVVNQNVKARK